MAYGKVEKTKRIVRSMEKQHKPKMGGMKAKPMKRASGRGR